MPTTAPAAADTPTIGVWVAVCVYLLVFAWFFPSVLTISDEAAYMRQARAFATNSAAVSEIDAFTGAQVRVLPSDYPPGTSLLMAPLMWVGGWRGGFLLGAACCAGTTLLLASLLRRLRRSPLFALFFLAYPPTLVISRCGMSDLPAALFACASLYVFWRWQTAGARFAAGLMAGLTLLFRETTPLLLAFFFIGALLRRERGYAALVIGGMLGVATRGLASWLMFGDPFYVKTSYPGFGLAAMTDNVAIYAGALLVMIPGGALWAALYRGERRVEVMCTLGAFLLLHLLYGYSAEASGGLKQWILAPRFFIPAMPILILAMAEAAPRIWHWALSRLRAGAQHALTTTAFAFTLGVCIEVGFVAWYHENWSQHQWQIVAALHSQTEPRTPVLTNLDASRKFFNELYEDEFGSRAVADFESASPAQIQQALDRLGHINVALVLRGESAHWIARSEQLQSRLKELEAAFVVLPQGETNLPGGERVQIFKVRRR